MNQSLRTRARWRARQTILRVIGRPVHCGACGREMFHAIVVIRRGRVRIIGATDHDLRVAFGGRDSVELRHLDLDQCPAPERPWVP